MSQNRKTIMKMLRNAIIVATIFVFFGYYIPRLQAQFIDNEHYFTLRRPVSLNKKVYKKGDRPVMVTSLKALGTYPAELVGEIITCSPDPINEPEINGVVIAHEVLVEESENKGYETRLVENLVIPERHEYKNDCYFFSLHVCYFIQFHEEKCFSFSTDTFQIEE